MTPEERDERQEQLIDETVNRLIEGETINIWDDNGASIDMTLGKLLIREVEDHSDGFDDFMKQVHNIIANCNGSGRMRVDRILMATYRGLLIDQAERIARPWVEDYIEEIERAVIDEAADEDARRRFDDRQDVMNGGL